MKIIIVGAGLGGLSAALCFAKCGHQVQLLERRSSLTPRGGGINIRPGASRILHSWGLELDLEEISEKTPAVVLRTVNSGDVVRQNVAVDISEHPDWGTSRQEVIKVLYKRACEAGVSIIFDVTVIDVHDEAREEFPSVELKNGKQIYGDLILAADGIRSRIRTIVLSSLQCSVDPIISNTTMYGAQVPCEQLSNQPGTTRLTDQVNINCWLGHNIYAITRYNPKTQNVGLLYAVKSDTDQKEDLWDEHGDIEYVRRAFAESCSELATALQLAEGCDRWKLAEMPDLPRWTSSGGRVVLLGDSAHAMHPNAAQGFSQIVEDIGVLDALIEKSPKGTSISQITSSWQALRKPRVERIKEYAKWNTQLYSGGFLAPPTGLDKGDAKNLTDVKPDMSAEFSSFAFLKWVLDYDAVGEAENYVGEGHPKL